METLQTDPFGELPGYRGSMTLVDRDNARLVGIGFYASAGHAKEADALLTTTWYESVADRVPDAIRPGARNATGHRRPVRDRPARLRVGHVPLVLPHPCMPVPSRRRATRLAIGKALVAVARRFAAPRKVVWRSPQRRLNKRSRRGRKRAAGPGPVHHQPMIVKTAFAVLLMVSLLGIAACSDDDADEADDRVPGHRNDCDDRRRAP